MAAPTSSPVNAGHAYANEADDFEDREQWDRAVIAHSLAAEQFQKAIVYAQDPEAVKTLRLLVMNHTRKASALSRKAAKVNDAQATKRDSSNPFSSSYPPSSPTKPNETRSQTLNNRFHTSHNINDRFPATSHNNNYHSHLLDTESQVIDGSYALLNDQNEDDSDPFNKFWNAVETLVQKLSNPVAFASVPLNEEDNPNALIEDSNMFTAPQKSERNPVPKSSTKSQIEASMMESFFVVPRQAPGTQPVPPGADNLDKASIPENSIPSKTIEEYALENRSLKNTVDVLSRQVAYWKKSAEEGNVLKSSILQFRNDMQKQAKRIMQSQESMRSSMVYGQYGANSGLSKQSKPSDGSSGLVANPQARIKELEEESRALRLENNRQKDLMGKYKERWEKLKESAKKRRAQPSPAENDTMDQNGTNRLEENTRPSQPLPSNSGERTLLRTLAQQAPNQLVVQSVQTSLPPFAAISYSPSRLRYENGDNSEEDL